MFLYKTCFFLVAFIDDFLDSPPSSSSSSFDFCSNEEDFDEVSSFSLSASEVVAASTSASTSSAQASLLSPPLDSMKAWGGYGKKTIGTLKESGKG